MQFETKTVADAPDPFSRLKKWLLRLMAIGKTGKQIYGSRLRQ
jgi:hypothetical protein